MTAQEIIHRVDELIPNAIPSDPKLFWLADLDLTLAATFHMDGEMDATPDRELLLQPPWQKLYLHYLEACIHYAYQDTARFNQASSMFQAAYEQFQNHHNRTHLPEEKNIQYF